MYRAMYCTYRLLTVYVVCVCLCGTRILRMVARNLVKVVVSWICPLVVMCVLSVYWFQVQWISMAIVVVCSSCIYHCRHSL